MRTKSITSLIANAAAFLVVDAELSILEVADALQEYDERFGGEAGE